MQSESFSGKNWKEITAEASGVEKEEGDSVAHEMIRRGVYRRGETHVE